MRVAALLIAVAAIAPFASVADARCHRVADLGPFVSGPKILFCEETESWRSDGAGGLIEVTDGAYNTVMRVVSAKPPAELSVYVRNEGLASSCQSLAAPLDYPTSGAFKRSELKLVRHDVSEVPGVQVLHRDWRDQGHLLSTLFLVLGHQRLSIVTMVSGEAALDEAKRAHQSILDRLRMHLDG